MCVIVPEVLRRIFNLPKLMSRFLTVKSKCLCNPGLACTYWALLPFSSLKEVPVCSESDLDLCKTTRMSILSMLQSFCSQSATGPLAIPFLCHRCVSIHTLVYPRLHSHPACSSDWNHQVTVLLCANERPQSPQLISPSHSGDHTHHNIKYLEQFLLSDCLN